MCVSFTRMYRIFYRDIDFLFDANESKSVFVLNFCIEIVYRGIQLNFELMPLHQTIQINLAVISYPAVATQI